MIITCKCLTCHLCQLRTAHVHVHVHGFSASQLEAFVLHVVQVLVL